MQSLISAGTPERRDPREPLDAAQGRAQRVRDAPDRALPARMSRGNMTAGGNPLLHTTSDDGEV